MAICIAATFVNVTKEMEDVGGLQMLFFNIQFNFNGERIRQTFFFLQNTLADVIQLSGLVQAGLM